MPYNTDWVIIFGDYLIAVLVNWCHFHQIPCSWYAMFRKVLEKFTNHDVIPPMEVLDQL